MLVNFADDVRQPWTPGFIDSLYDGPSNPKSVANFWHDASWGQISVSADVYGWYTIAETTANGCRISETRDQANAAATAAGVDLTQYTNIVYVYPYHEPCRGGGTGEMPGTHSWIALTTACVEATGVCSERSAFMHEFGHNLGLDHSGDAAGQYGDTFSVMGCCSTAQIPNIQRLQLGFIPPSQVVTVTSSQTITVTAATSQASIVYRIADGSENYVYLENRAIRTIWENGNGENWVGGKLLLRIAPDYTVFTQTPRGPAYPMTTLIDADPGTSSTQKGLPVGSTWTLPNGVTITNVAFDGANNTVQVTI